MKQKIIFGVKCVGVVLACAVFVELLIAFMWYCESLGIRM